MQNTKEPDRIHNPTSPCSCHVRHFNKVLDGKTYNHEEIVYCPVHSAAPELLEALHKLTLGVEFALAESDPSERLRQLELMFLGYTPELAMARTTITKATGGQW